MSLLSQLAYAQVQASAWSRWRFGDKTAKAPEDVHSGGAEIFIMLPLSIIGVGELVEGEEVSFIHQCAHTAGGVLR
jgi:hypothetical protein